MTKFFRLLFLSGMLFFYAVAIKCCFFSVFYLPQPLVETLSDIVRLIFAVLLFLITGILTLGIGRNLFGHFLMILQALLFSAIAYCLAVTIEQSEALCVFMAMVCCFAFEALRKLILMYRERYAEQKIEKEVD